MSSTLYATKDWTGDFMPNNDSLSLKIPQGSVVLARETREKAWPGCLTYVIDYSAYRSCIG